MADPVKDEELDSAAAIRFRKPRGQIAWFLGILCLGSVFAVTAASVLKNRLVTQWSAGAADPLVDGLWILSCVAIFLVLAWVGVEFVRFLRKRVEVEDRGLRIGDEFFEWEQIEQLRESRQFRSGSWFYHLEVRGRAGRRAYLTSKLVADYEGLKRAMLSRGRGLRLVLLPD